MEADEEENDKMEDNQDDGKLIKIKSAGTGNDDTETDELKPIQMEEVKPIQVEDIKSILQQKVSIVEAKRDSAFKELKNMLITDKNIRKSVLFEFKTNADQNDIISDDPSYTNFDIPYVVKCKMRYCKKSRDYDKQFKKEIKTLEIFQQNAYEAARFSRHLGMTTLWPPLHNRREINKFIQHYFVQTPKDRQRLQYLIKEPQT